VEGSCTIGGNLATKDGAAARYKAPVEVRLMRTIKQAIDPKGLINAGKVLGDQHRGKP
jgi:hypothetical protein